MAKRAPKCRPAQEPRTLPFPPSGYQPSKAELEEEFDMPGVTDQKVRERFFRPFRFERGGAGQRGLGEHSHERVR